MRTEITPGQTSDYLGFDLVMADNLPEPRVLLADRGYDSDNIREKMEARSLLTQIPMRKSRKMRVGVNHSAHSDASGRLFRQHPVSHSGVSGHLRIVAA